MRIVIRFAKAILRPIWVSLYRSIYPATIAALYPVNVVLAFILRHRVRSRSVLHVNYMNHVPYYWVKILRQHGVDAAYLAVGTSPYWNKSDYSFEPAKHPLATALKEFWVFWTVVARYEVVHAHFMITHTRSQWELPFLKRMKRTLVVYWAGCEIRDRDRNMQLHPKVNICQVCDYDASICRSPLNKARQRMAKQYGDVTLVSTPDLRDFVPEGIHFPFFAPPDLPVSAELGLPQWPNKAVFRIVHATVHPGIEGTAEIQAIIRRLRDKGWPVQFEFLHLVEHHKVLDALREADLAIGKMKMGYYANFQIEAMAMGVPTITYVRDDLMTDELRNSGFIFATLQTLEETLEYYLQHPEALADKRAKARGSILALHNNDHLTQRLIALYRTETGSAPRSHGAALR